MLFFISQAIKLTCRNSQTRNDYTAANWWGPIPSAKYLSGWLPWHWNSKSKKCIVTCLLNGYASIAGCKITCTLDVIASTHHHDHSPVLIPISLRSQRHLFFHTITRHFNSHLLSSHFTHTVHSSFLLSLLYCFSQRLFWLESILYHWASLESIPSVLRLVLF